MSDYVSTLLQALRLCAREAIPLTKDLACDYISRQKFVALTNQVVMDVRDSEDRSKELELAWEKIAKAAGVV